MLDVPWKTKKKTKQEKKRKEFKSWKIKKLRQDKNLNMKKRWEKLEHIDLSSHIDSSHLNFIRIMLCWLVYCLFKFPNWNILKAWCVWCVRSIRIKMWKCLFNYSNRRAFFHIFSISMNQVKAEYSQLYSDFYLFIEVDNNNNINNKAHINKLKMIAYLLYFKRICAFATWNCFFLILKLFFFFVFVLSFLS